MEVYYTILGCSKKHEGIEINCEVFRSLQYRCAVWVVVQNKWLAFVRWPVLEFEGGGNLRQVHVLVSLV